MIPRYLLQHSFFLRMEVAAVVNNVTFCMTIKGEEGDKKGP